MEETVTVPLETANREYWRGRPVVVVGLARSGQAAALLLAARGAQVRAVDQRDAAVLGLDPAAWAARGIDLRLGPHRALDLEGMTVAVLSPGIPKTAPVVEDILRRGLPIVSEIEAASQFAVAPMAAVTGTNGKSTTVTVLGQLVAALDRPVEVAGNIGLALSAVVERVPAHGFLVVEVSSFQLEDVHGFHPRAAAVLNVTPDHLDRYASLDAYAATKTRIFARQGPEDVAVVPAHDVTLEPHLGRLRSRVLRFGPGDFAEGVALTAAGLELRERGAARPIARTEDVALPGPHNHANVAAALALLHGLGLPVLDPRIAAALGGLRGLPHRLERIEGRGGVVCFNDSKATNPDSLEVALRSFEGRVVLVAGGRPKESDYGRLVPLLERHAAEVILIGEASARLRRDWAPAGIPLVEMGTDFEEAVGRALAVAARLGLPVLLSPGCASFDMFRDYEDRGDRFRALVRGAAGEER